LSGGDAYGTFLDGDNIYSKKLNIGDATKSLIVIGNESNGISPAVASAISSRLFIPPYPEDERGSESLNAAVATAVTVAEFRRRAHSNNPAL
jgi:TrmH family RNA methyltransferase